MLVIITGVFSVDCDSPVVMNMEGVSKQLGFILMVTIGEVVVLSHYVDNTRLSHESCQPPRALFLNFFYPRNYRF